MKRIIAIALCLVMVFALFAACDSSTEKKEEAAMPEQQVKAVAEKFARAAKLRDAEALIDLLQTEEDKEMTDKRVDSMDNLFDKLKKYKVQISVQIGDATKMDGEALEDYRQRFQLNNPGVEIQEAWTVETELVITVDGEQTVRDLQLGIVCVESAWYMDLSTMGRFETILAGVIMTLIAGG